MTDYLAWASPKQKIGKPMVFLSFRIAFHVYLLSSVMTLGHFFPPDILVRITWNQMSLLQVTLPLISHHFMPFWKMRGAIVTWPSKFNITFETFWLFNFYFLVVTFQCIRLTKPKLTPPGWPLLKLWIWSHSVIIFCFFFIFDMIMRKMT